ncbi:MAG: tyrosine-type recombinase/integrase [Candidatus Sulfotelmatobacter sp.]
MNFPTLSAHAEEFLALKRAVAKVDPHRNTQDRRSLRHRERLLRSFIAYWRDCGCPWPIRSSLVVDWIAVGSHRHHPYRDQRRFYVVRAFLQQIRTFEPATEILENVYRPLYRRRTPHLYSEDDITRLMDAVWRLQTVTPFRRATVYALIGLLASTGLRIGEALALNVDDVKLRANPPHLLISDSKFGNSRNVVLHPSVAKQLRKYLLRRSKALASRHVKAFFINRFGRHLNYNAQRLTFLRLLRRAGIRAVPGQRGPSIHSFRHSFAVRRLTLWHRERRDVQKLLPHLAVYLGHVGPENTYWYVFLGRIGIAVMLRKT